jgi:ABC-type microcin C transport system permease subunit YejB
MLLLMQAESVYLYIFVLVSDHFDQTADTTAEHLLYYFSVLSDPVFCLLVRCCPLVRLLIKSCLITACDGQMMMMAAHKRPNLLTRYLTRVMRDVRVEPQPPLI